MNRKVIVLLVMLLSGILLQAAPLGFLEPYNFMIESEPMLAKRKWQWNFISQTCVDTTSYNGDGDIVNALQIYQPEQNALGLFQGIANNPLEQLINSVAGGSGGALATQSNGLFVPTGQYTGYQVAFLSSLRFHHNCYFKLALPVYNLELSDVNWLYAGKTTTFAGAQIQDEIVATFLQQAQDEFGLSLQGWKVAGLGDLALLLDYIGDFPQGRAVLRNVRVHLRAGLTFPTGQMSNENLVMSQPLGADGSMTLPFGGGLDINLGRYLQTGFRAQFSYIWGNAKERRIPTFDTQTSLLYPTTAWTFKNYGITQTFDLYVQLYNVTSGISFKAAYEYYFKAQDVISLAASSNIAQAFSSLNTDIVLDEITRNNIIAQVAFDSAYLEKFDAIHPQLSLFASIPFNGSFTTAATTVGAQLSLDW